jgi:hypothetical protein
MLTGGPATHAKNVYADAFVTTTGGLVTCYGVNTTAVLATGPLGSVTTTNVFASYVSTTGANVQQTVQAGRVFTPYLTVQAYADISATGIYFTASGAPNSGTLHCTKALTTDLSVPGVAELSSTGIMLTGGPATYAKNVYADTVYANTLYATGAAQIVGASLNAGDVSTNSGDRDGNRERRTNRAGRLHQFYRRLFDGPRDLCQRHQRADRDALVH